MNDNDLDHTDEKALNHEISDETLEAAAERSREPSKTTYSILTPFCV